MDLPLDLPEERSWSGCVAASQVFIQRAGRRLSDGTALSIRRAGRRPSDGTALSACGATTQRWHGFVYQACDRCVAPDEPCGSCHKPRSGVGDESFQWLDSACHSRLACCVCPMWRSWWSWGHVSPPGAEFWRARGHVSPPGAEFWRARGHVSPLVPSSVGEGACFAPGAEFWWSRGHVSPPGAEFWWLRGHVSPLVPSSVG